MITIIVTQEDNQVNKYEFTASQRVISIGRRSSNDLCIPDLSISGNHAKITFQDGHAWLEDLNSTNGTYVNGQVVFRHSVSKGDDIMMGKIRLAVQNETDSVQAERAATQQSRVMADIQSVPAGSSPEIRSENLPNRTSNYSTEPDREAALAAHSSNDTFTGVVEADIERSDSLQPRTTGHNGVASALRDPAPDTPSVKQSGSNAKHPLDGMEHLVVPADKVSVKPTHDLDSPSPQSKGAVIEIKNGAKSGQILPIDKPVTTLGRPGIQIAAIMRKPDGYFLMHIESDESVERPTLNRDAIGDEPVLLHSGDELNVAGIDVEFMLS
ncbi:MAG: FHA domain-containing protein [Granulosicoccus sp.]